ncbi:MAG: phosphoglycolate phosphatase [Lysobacteraceae bacterium]
MSRRAVLFDLDGTLVDSAPDLWRAANAVRAAQGLAPMDFAAFRPQVSRGARAMLAAALPDHAVEQRESLLDEFLQRYASDVASETRLFSGMEQLLQHIESRGLAWGVVSNKAERLASLVMQALDLQQRAAVLIGGDTCAERKPHPLPLQEACRRLQVAPAQCLYLGDDPRDIEAARAAGIRSIAVTWGYAERQAVLGWGADRCIDAPLDLLDEDLLA